MNEKELNFVAVNAIETINGLNNAMINAGFNSGSMYNVAAFYGVPEIKKVIFNDPATIILWEDGTKTVVKAQDKDQFDKEKGLAMAIVKKALGNEGRYYEIFKKWLKEDGENK